MNRRNRMVRHGCSALVRILPSLRCA
jgi:hypothetical protein